METLWIRLNHFHAAESFAALCSRFDADFEVLSGEHSASGKSLLGLLTLNLSAPLELRIRAGKEDISDFLKGIEPYRIRHFI